MCSNVLTNLHEENSLIVYGRSNGRRRIPLYKHIYHPSKTNVNLIWRNGVLCTNLQSDHLGISMIDSNTTEYIAKKYFQIIQPLAIRKYIFLIWFCTLFTPELECISLFKNDVNVYHSVSYKPDN